jgi:signal peptidase I
VTSSDPETWPDATPPAGDDHGADADQENRKRKQLPFWLEFPLLVGVALLVAILIKTFLFQAFYIPSGSMENTLEVNDRVLVNKLAYRIGDIQRGDVIVFDDPRGGFGQAEESVVDSALRNLFESIGLAAPRSEFIKRVIGLPGEVVEGRDGVVFVNGVPLYEPYLKDPGEPISTFGPIDVPADALFVMGDNRSESQDSRFFGPIPTEDVVGKAFVIIWPPSRWGGL